MPAAAGQLDTWETEHLYTSPCSRRSFVSSHETTWYVVSLDTCKMAEGELAARMVRTFTSASEFQTNRHTEARLRWS